MLALTFGLMAACTWAVHDLLVRQVSQRMAILPMILTVLGAGTAALLVPALALGDWSGMGGAALALALGAGVAYALAMGGLYKAFSMAPVRYVAPVVGAYPMISLAFAAAGGRVIAAPEWLAVAAIVAGIAVVAITGRAEPGGTGQSPPRAIAWSAAGSAGFALAFWLGQAAARQSAELPAILVTRIAALAVIACGTAVFAGAVYRRPRAVLGGNLGALALMGVLDAVALGLVTAAGGLPRPEYAAIAASMFGVLTILLAARLLGEAVWPPQWIGIAMVFGGVATLSSLG